MVGGASPPPPPPCCSCGGGETDDWELGSGDSIELTAADFDAGKEDMISFDLKDKYLFSEQEFELPVKISYGVNFMKPGEFIPLWSKNKKEWP